jgi:hypothetical protein
VSTPTDPTAAEPSFLEQAAALARSQGSPPFVGAQLDGTPMRLREDLVR